MFGDEIRAERVRRGWSQEKLAKLAGVSTRKLAQIEDSENVSLTILRRICTVLELKTVMIGADLVARTDGLPPALHRLLGTAERAIAEMRVTIASPRQVDEDAWGRDLEERFSRLPLAKQSLFMNRWLRVDAGESRPRPLPEAGQYETRGLVHEPIRVPDVSSFLACDFSYPVTIDPRHVSTAVTGPSMQDILPPGTRMVIDTGTQPKAGDLVAAYVSEMGSVIGWASHFDSDRPSLVRSNADPIELWKYKHVVVGVAAVA